jgi:hypothetical protein
MSDEHETDAGQEPGPSKDDPGAGTESEGGEGKRNADATPPISEEGEHGQTQVPAPDEDAGSSED